MTKVDWRRALLFCVALVTLSGFLYAQGGLTAVRGVVRDPTGAVIPGVEVTLTDAGTGVARTVLSDETGTYLVSQLQPGSYTLRAELSGFKARLVNNVLLPVNETITLNVQLEVGALSDVVEVVSAADAVSTVDAKLGTGFDSKKILDLPLNARNIVGLLGLQAGVSLNQQDGGQVNGARPDQQNIVLDGVNINRQETGSAMQGALPTTLDSVQEFIVQTAGTDAASGRGSGGQVQLVTRRGSNEWHGSAYEFYRTNGTSAANYFAPKDAATGKKQVTPLIRNIPGGSLGGPVFKDRLFVFGAFERRTDRSGSLESRTVPTPELLNGELRYRRTDGTFGVLTTGCGGMLEAFSTIPCDTWNPALIGSRGWWEKYRPFSTEAGARLAAGDNTVRGGDNGANLLTYRFNAPKNQNSNVYISRLDYTLNSKHTVYFRGTLNDTVEIDSAETFPGFGNSRDRIDNSKGFAANWNWVISPTVNNNFTAGLTREAVETTGSARESYSPRFSNFFQTTGGVVQAINTWNFVDQLSWIKGRHNFQMGANIRTIQNQVNSYATVVLGNYGADANLTANNIGVASSPGLLRALGATEFGRVSSPQTVGDAVLAATGSATQFAEDVQYDVQGNKLARGLPFIRDLRLQEYEFYFQDSLRLNANTTVNAGLLYGFGTPPYEGTGLQVNWVQDMGQRWRDAHDTPLNTMTMPLLTTQAAGRVNGKPDYYKTDKNNFAPRVSIAWTPQFNSGILGFFARKGGPLVVRSGYSLSFDGMGRSFARNAAQGGSIGLKTRFGTPGFSYSFDGQEGAPRAPRVTGNIDGLNLPRAFFPNAPAKSDFSLPLSTGSTAGCAVGCGAGGASSIAIDPSLHAARNHLINLTLSKELPGGWVVEASYVGRIARDLIGSVDIASPINVRDPKSGMTYYDAIKELYEKYETTNSTLAAVLPTIQPIAWFENVYKDKAETAARIRGLAVQPNATQTFFSLLHRVRAPGPNTQASITDTIQDIETRAGSLLLQPQVQFFGLFTNYSLSNYHSGQFIVRRRFSNGFSFTGNYTLSKSLDITSAAESRGERPSNNEGLSHDPYHPEWQYGLSDFDRRHQVNVNSLYQLPFGRGKWIGSNMPAALNHIVGGWEISGIATATSGRPFTYTSSSRFNHHYFGQSFPVMIKPIPLELQKGGGDVYLIGPDEATRRAFALDNFKNTYPGGAVPRNEGRNGPGFFNVDLSIAKAIQFTESFTGRLRVEAFNAFNHPNFSNPNTTDIDSNLGSNLGRITSTSANNERVMQFSFRLSF